MGYIGTAPADAALTATDIADGIIAKNHIAEDRGGIGGLTCSNNGTDGDHDIDIAVGYATDYGNAVVMELTSSITKQIDATWAVGTNAGGLDTGAVAASTGYGVYLIRRSDTGVVDALFSTDMSAAGSSVTMPTNYDQKRLIGWVRTDSSSNILAFTQSGDYFRLTGTLPTELTDATITDDTYETLTLTSPPLCLAHVGVDLTNSSETATFMRLYLKTKGASDVANSQQHCWIAYATGGTDHDWLSNDGFVLSDSASQVEYATNETTDGATIKIGAIGCNMLTRSNP